MKKKHKTIFKIESSLQSEENICREREREGEEREGERGRGRERITDSEEWGL
jgi:hypothetical protein